MTLSGEGSLAGRYSRVLLGVLLGRTSGKRHERLTMLVGVLLAFLMGYLHVARQPLQDDWAQNLMLPAVNYACTGNFGPIRLTQDATPADTAALAQLGVFLSLHQTDFSCGLFPRHMASASFLDGVDATNVEQPLYLILTYGVLWRVFGPHWDVTYYVIATTFALSFLIIYLCARAFMSALVAAVLALYFIAELLLLPGPFHLSSVLSPRDALKLPFAVGIAALLIGSATPLRKPIRFLSFACGVGLTIGLGYGFKSDLLMFLPPAAVVIALLGQLDLPISSSLLRRLLANAAIRISAIALLILSFGAAAWMPLLNDHYLHEHYEDTGYAPLAMGLLSGRGGMYLARSDIDNDVSAGIRILEYASRRYHDDVEYAAGAYWTYAKRYYLAVVGYIPADIFLGGIGTFVNLMWLPLAPTANFAPLFAANLFVFFQFLCLIARRFNFRSAVATIVVLGSVLMVSSLKVGLRYTFYLYVFYFIAWGSVLFFWLRLTFARWLDDRENTSTVRPLYGHLAAARMVAGLLLIAGILAFAVLSLARHYQSNMLRSLIADWTKRPKIAANFEVSDLGSGKSLIRILSPMPISRGGYRAANASILNKVEMGVVALEFDGKLCADRPVTVTALSEPSSSHPSVDVASIRPAFSISETFSIALRSGQDYSAFLPAFNYRIDDAWGNSTTITYSGIQIDNSSLPCLRSVSLITEFKKEDVLFEFFVPSNPNDLRPDDLFRRVYVPGLHFI
jgi:hypothetical protein